MREPHPMAVFKVALVMKLFEAIGGRAVDLSLIGNVAVATVANQLLVRRIAHLTVEFQILNEVDVDIYAKARFPKSMIDPTGFSNALQHNYHLEIHQMANSWDQNCSRQIACDRLDRNVEPKLTFRPATLVSSCEQT